MLAIPAAIFIFLKFFGDNRFDIEIFYQNGAPATKECEATTGQFYIADSLAVSVDKPQVILFSQTNGDNEIQNIEVRLNDTFKENLFVHKIENGSNNLTTIHCGYRSESVDKIILIDDKRRVRGYYDRDLDEIDRLIVEVKIILENEERDSGK